MDWTVTHPPNLYVEVLTRGILECDCIWRSAFKEMIMLKLGN